MSKTGKLKKMSSNNFFFDSIKILLMYPGTKLSSFKIIQYFECIKCYIND